MEDNHLVWNDLLQPYLGAYLRCPEAAYRHMPARKASGYALNVNLVYERTFVYRDPLVLQPLQRTQAPYPATTVEFLDAPAGTVSMGSPIAFFQGFKSLRSTFRWRAYKTETQHLGEANYSMLDGSVRRVRPGQWSSQQDGTRPSSQVWPP